MTEARQHRLRRSFAFFYVPLSCVSVVGVLLGLELSRQADSRPVLALGVTATAAALVALLGVLFGRAQYAHSTRAHLGAVSELADNGKTVTIFLFNGGVGHAFIESAYWTLAIDGQHSVFSDFELVREQLVAAGIHDHVGLRWLTRGAPLPPGTNAVADGLLIAHVDCCVIGSPLERLKLAVRYTDRVGDHHVWEKDFTHVLLSARP